MKKVLCSVSFVLFAGIASFSQTWNQEVAVIFHENCAQCHNEQGIGGFPLLTYTDVLDYSDDIQAALEEGIMPPWPANPSYRHFKDERVLSDAELATLESWFMNGMPEGGGNSPAPPVISTDALMTDPDFVWDLETYEVSMNTDEYRTFVIPLNNTETKYLTGAEFIPGNTAAVHHYLLYYDPGTDAQAADDADPGPGFGTNGANFPVPNAVLMDGWAPGSYYQGELPINAGSEIPPNASLVLEMHFAGGHLGETDNSQVRLKFSDNPDNMRPRWVDPILYHYPPCLQEPWLIIPANTTPTFHQESDPINVDLTMLTVFPHMHQIGSTYKVWLVNPQNDTIPIIDVDQWDFHWQYWYTFQQPIHFEAGSVFYSEATYDNTAANDDNPNDPPILVTLGEGSGDEMLLTFFAFTYYLPGDENIVLDSTILSTPNLELVDNWNFYPNPSGSKFYGLPLDFDAIQVFDPMGRIVAEIEPSPGEFIKVDLSVQPSGVYTAVIRKGNAASVRRLVKN